jgi:ribosomal protein S18 acetylase RimI-like enzyme
VAPRIVFRPLDLRYREFAACNARCFANEPISEEEFRLYRRGDFWAIRSGGVLVGFGIMTRTGQRGHIKRVAVVAEHRGKGLGQALVAGMIARGRDLSCDVLRLSVEDDNASAIHIYHKAGFEVAGRAYQHVVDAEKRDCVRGRRVDGLSLTPITECDREGLPKKVLAWRDAHRPPDNLVLVLTARGEGYVGFCRLSPVFPGCSPLELDRPERDLGGFLTQLETFLPRDRRSVRLTCASDGIARAAESEGLALNYGLLEMELRP